MKKLRMRLPGTVDERVPSLARRADRASDVRPPELSMLSQLTPQTALAYQQVFGNASMMRRLAQRRSPAVQRHPMPEANPEEHFKLHLDEALQSFEKEMLPEQIIHLSQLRDSVQNSELLEQYGTLLKTIDSAEYGFSDKKREKKTQKLEKSINGDQLVVVEVGATAKSTKDFESCRP